MEESYEKMISGLEKLKMNVEEIALNNSRMIDIARDPKKPETEDASLKIDHLKEQLRSLRSKNFDDLRTITRLEEKLKKKEEEADVVKSKLTMVEEVLYKRDEEIFEAILSLSKIFPAVNQDVPQDERRIIGTLDMEIFRAACVLHEAKEEETESDITTRAENLYNLWKGLLAIHEAGGEQPVDLLNELRIRFGDDIYYYMRKVFQEKEMAMTLEMSLKPWNTQRERPKTLYEILTEIPELAE